MPATMEQIQSWDRELRAGHKVVCGGSELDKAIIVAVARNIRNAGPDRSDSYGQEAFDAVNSALSA